jgi:hypothetical protein
MSREIPGPREKTYDCPYKGFTILISVKISATAAGILSAVLLYLWQQCPQFRIPALRLYWLLMPLGERCG